MKEVHSPRGVPATAANVGTGVAVRGSVVEVRFDGPLPPIHSVLRAGDDGRIVIEVLAQREARQVRGIALPPTQGLARGMAVTDTGGPLMAPVGKGILSRMFDVFGNTIDRGVPLAEVQWRSVHRAPPPLARRSTKSEIFETGIKAIDVLVPLERGGKAGLFGGAGVGKTVLLTEMIHHMIGHQEGGGGWRIAAGISDSLRAFPSTHCDPGIDSVLSPTHDCSCPSGTSAMRRCMVATLELMKSTFTRSISSRVAPEVRILRSPEPSPRSQWRKTSSRCFSSPMPCAL